MSSIVFHQNPVFKRKLKIEKYPIYGFYYIGVVNNGNTTFEGIESLLSGEDTKNSITSPLILPCARIWNSNIYTEGGDIAQSTFDYVVSFQRLKDEENNNFEDLKLSSIAICYFDMVELDELPQDLHNLTKLDLRKLQVAYWFNYMEGNNYNLPSDWSNIAILFNSTQIKADIRRLVPEDKEVFYHLESYAVDKRTAYDRNLTNNQFIEKISALQYAADQQYSSERDYNTFGFEASGAFNF